MAVTDESLYHPTEDLILPNPRKYYRALIHTSHWQLRSLISSPQQGIVVYPSGKDVIRLDTRTREREVIATLSFAPRCLSASRHWVCCGGDDGHYVTVYLDERRRRLPGSTSAETDPDARLPLDLDLPRRSSLRDPSPSSDTLGGSRRSRGPLLTMTTKVGTEIVNCIELWSPCWTTVSEKAYHVPVAVVSNNDHTVSIIDIAQSEVLEELAFPDCVNVATMSPDGDLLIALCDDPFLYVYERVQQASAKQKQVEQTQGARYEWALRGRIQLEGQRESDKTVMRGSFAASFSGSGKYLAVATQYGVISIFETATLAKEGAESLLEVFTSSRPGRDAGPGAVRAMQFSPGPFDLLAWTESSGRACVADVRNLFRSRQLINIDSHAEGVERMIVTERVGEPIIDPRLRSFRAESPHPSSTTPEFRNSDLERSRQLRQLTREMMDRDQAPLTSEELQVLQAHRVARRQRDAANAARGALAEASNNSGTGLASRIYRDVERRPYPSASRDLLSTSERLAPSIRTYTSEIRNQDRESQLQLDLEPLHLNLIQLADADSAVEHETTAGNDTSSNLERLVLTGAPRQATTGSGSSSTLWPELDALYRSRYPTDAPIARSARVLGAVEDFANRLRQPWLPRNELARLGIVVRDENNSRLRGMSRMGSVATMGCSWSEDGRILYIGAEDGIHEYHVNVAGRKIFPSLVLR